MVRYYPTRILAEMVIHGGKTYMCRDIFRHAPLYYTKFLDAFGGAGSMTYNAPKALNCRVYNDLNPSLVNCKIVIRDRVKELMAELEGIKYCEEEFYKVRTARNMVQEVARRIIKNRMSRNGNMTEFAVRDRIRGGQNEGVNSWEECVARLPILSQRLQGVMIKNQDALDLLGEKYSKDWFIYLDPPYVFETRTSVGEYGSFEMPDYQHEMLLDLIRDSPNQIALSGYHSELYDSMLSKWRTVEFNVPNHSGQDRIKSRRVEVLWMNY